MPKHRNAQIDGKVWECRKGGLGKEKNGCRVAEIFANVGSNENNPGEVERIKAFVTRNGVSFRSQPAPVTKGHFSQ